MRSRGRMSIKLDDTATRCLSSDLSREMRKGKKQPSRGRKTAEKAEQESDLRSDYLQQGIGLMDINPFFLKC